MPHKGKLNDEIERQKKKLRNSRRKLSEKQIKAMAENAARMKLGLKLKEN